MTFSNPFLIFNPASGRLARSPERLEALLRRLRADLPALTPLATARAGHATELAREAVGRGADLVLVAGGDGSVNEVVNGLGGTRVAVGLLPSGTANVLATETGIPRNPVAAAAALGAMVPVRIALGRVKPDGGEERLFVAMCGAGLDAAVIARLNPGLKKRIGKGAYWWAGLSLIGGSLPRVRAGGRETGFALASRVRNYGGDLTIASSASLLRGDLRVLVFEGDSTWRYLVYLGAALIGKAESLRGANAYSTGSVRFEGEGAWQVDGEYGGALPATVEIVEDALTLLVPRAFAERG